jgi:uncharacterized protein YuzE
MRIEYEQETDLLYVRFAKQGIEVERTDTLSPGVLADFDSEGRLVGVEVIEARATLGDNVQVEVSLTQPK